MKNEKPYNLSAPFREKDLLNVNMFIRHVSDRGITTSRRELAFYQQQGLLTPAIQIVAPAGSQIAYGVAGWLKRYEVASEASAHSMAFYTPLQIFSLALVQQNRTIKIVDEDMEVIERFLTNSKTTLLTQIARYHEAFSVINSILTAHEEMITSVSKTAVANPFLLEDENVKVTDFTARWEKDNLRSVASKILQKHNLSPKELENMAVWFAESGFKIDPILYWRPLLSRYFPLKTKEGASGASKFTSDFYETSKILLWLLQGVNKKTPSWDDIYKKYNVRLGRKLCIICNSTFSPKKGGREQVTCSKECQKENKRNLNSTSTRKRKPRERKKK
ncbi:MAG: hypothetical protein WC045_02140 [Patescibacteria group bacterium]